MIDPNDVTAGDRVDVEIITVYQDFPDDPEDEDAPDVPEPYAFDKEIAEVERTEDEDEGVVITDLYLDRYDDDGNFDRRIRFRGASPEYQQGRGDGDVDEKTWAQMSRDEFCRVSEYEEPDAPDPDVEDAETDAEVAEAE